MLSMERFFPVPDGVAHQADEFYSRLKLLVGDGSQAAEAKGDGALVFRRIPEVKGPVSVFGYDYLEDHYGKERAEALRLMKYRGLYGGGGEYTYEALNLADGRRTAQEIRDALAAIYGPVPLELVLEYLKALEEIKLVERVSP